MTRLAKKSHVRKLFSNGLHIPDLGGDYFFIPDALVVPSKGTVWRHEVAHRIFITVRMEFSTFAMVRELASITHTLLAVIDNLARKNDVLLRGIKLGELRTDGGSSAVRLRIEDLLWRVQHVENIVDTAWDALELIAEFAAIDFSDGVGVEERHAKWLLQTTQQPDSDKRKLKLLRKLLDSYPISIHNRLLRAWNEYSSITNDRARRELARLCMVTCYLDDDRRVRSLDPVDVIFENAPAARANGDAAADAFFIERLIRGVTSHELLKSVERWALKDIDAADQRERELARAVGKFLEFQWTASDRDLDNELYELNPNWTAGNSLFGFCHGNLDVSMININPLLRMKRRLKLQDQRTLFTLQLSLKLQPDRKRLAYLKEDFLKKHPELWDEEMERQWQSSWSGVSEVFSLQDDLPAQESWWRRLLLLEKLRTALKEGEHIGCPLYGWRLARRRNKQSLKCDTSCLIRNWLEHADHWPDLLPKESICEG